MSTRTGKPHEAPTSPAHGPEKAMPTREYGQGRHKLLAATARLVALEGGPRLTLRDLAQEAGMSHNAIYRHFTGVDEIVHELVKDLNQRLRDGLRQARTQVPPGEVPSKTVVSWLFDFALANKDPFVVAIRQRHGPSGPARQVIEQGMAQIRAEMRADLQASGRLPPLPDDTLDTALKLIVQHTFELCLAYIDAPQHRPALLLEAEQVFMWCLVGATMSANPPSKAAPAPR